MLLMAKCRRNVNVELIVDYLRYNKFNDWVFQDGLGQLKIQKKTRFDYISMNRESGSGSRVCPMH